MRLHFGKAAVSKANFMAHRALRARREETQSRIRNHPGFEIGWE